MQSSFVANQVRLVKCNVPGGRKKESERAQVVGRRPDLIWGEAPPDTPIHMCHGDLSILLNMEFIACK